MRALTWQGKRSVSVEVPDPVIQEPTDAIVRITSSAICGSDLHLYEVLGPYMKAGDILGHEPMGIVEEVGSEVTEPQAGRPGGHPLQHFLRPLLDVQTGPAVPVRNHPGPCPQQRGAASSGSRSSTVRCPAARRSTCACRTPTTARSRSGRNCPDERYLYLSDILPTAWQGVKYADVPAGGTLAVFGLGPVGQFASRVGRHLGSG